MMQIGDLASRAGVTPRTIRYYEEVGIIAPDERTAGGFRLYSENQLRRLNIVQGLKMLGFDLERIRELFTINGDCKTGGMLAGELINHIREQQNEIDHKLEYYADMKESNAQAIEVLGECLCCSVDVFARDCHNCEIYQRHESIPDLIECSIYQV